MTVRSRNARSWETMTAPPGRSRHEALEPVEAVEVEVVRRLVEQEDVEAGEQDRGQRAASGLAARQRGGLERRAARGRARASRQTASAAAPRGRPPPSPSQRVERPGVRLPGAGLVLGERRRRGLEPGARGRPHRCGGRETRASVSPGAGRAPAAGSPRCRRRGAPSRGRARSTPARMRSSVDLPAPLGPTTPTTSPGATVSDTPASTVEAPKLLQRSRATSVRRASARRPQGRSCGSRCAVRTRAPCAAPPVRGLRGGR